MLSITHHAFTLHHHTHNIPRPSSSSCSVSCDFWIRVRERLTILILTPSIAHSPAGYLCKQTSKHSIQSMTRLALFTCRHANGWVWDDWRKGNKMLGFVKLRYQPTSFLLSPMAQAIDTLKRRLETILYDFKRARSTWHEISDHTLSDVNALVNALIQSRFAFRFVLGLA